VLESLNEASWGSYVLHNFPFYSIVRYKAKFRTRYVFVTKSLHDMQKEPVELRRYSAYRHLWSNEITTR
jgi:hypothetical protein